MTESPSRKVVTKKKAQTASRKARHKVAAERASTSSRVKAPSVDEEVRIVDEEVRIKDPQVAPDAMSAPSTTVSHFGATGVRVSMHGLAAKCAPQQIEDFRAEVPASLRELVETTVSQTRSFYQQSADAFQEAFESWESSLDAAGQGAVALNHKIVDIADRNIRNSFDLATRLLASKNLADALEVQTAYWRRQFGELRMQAEEVRVLLERVTATVAEPIKEEVGRDIEESIRRIRSIQP
jgi:hypothetical protein